MTLFRQSEPIISRGVKFSLVCRFGYFSNNGALRRRFDMRGIDFLGIHLQPESACESITQVFVEGAPFQFQKELFREPLSFYGRVTETKHLAVKGYPHIQSGTRMVSMCLQKPIPAFVTFAGFRCKVWYHDQPTTCFRCGQTGHMQSACPKRNQHDGQTFLCELCISDKRTSSVSG